MTTLLRTLSHLVLLMLLLAGTTFAQPEPQTTPEATDEEALPVIAYFQTYAFNVPVLTGWTNQSAGNVALFTHDDFNASIRVEDVITTSIAQQGIQQALEARFGDALPDEPAFTNTVNLGDGAWVQMIYQLSTGETVSAFANARNNRTYVITFSEENPEADTYMLIVQREEDEGMETSVLQAIQTLIDPDFTYEGVMVDTVTLPDSTREWTRYEYDSATAGTITALGYGFGRAVYTTISTKDDGDALALAQAFSTIHLGFFTTPDNIVYLFVGLVTTFVILGVLIFSMMWRWRGARQDLALLEQLRDASK